MFSKPAKVRVISSSKQLTIPPQVNFEPGDEVTVHWSDRIILVTPPSARVDEELLEQAIEFDG